jgi:hypothetical protein
MLATLTVNIDGDGIVTNNGQLTLREAIAYVNGTDTPGSLDSAQIDETQDQLGTNDKIVFSSGLNGETITLTQGELLITQIVTIDASLLSGGITIDGGGGTDGIVGNGDGLSVVQINVSEEVTLKNLKITGGDSSLALGAGIDFRGNWDE